MKYTSQNIAAIRKIASALGDLNNEVVYVGGAVISLYADDPAAGDVRPTKDLDIVVEIASQLKLEKLRKKLEEQNIHFDPNEKVLCRFRYENIKLDVMATKQIGWAPANPWFKAGFKNRIQEHLDDILIYIFPFVYLLASKYAAFHNRGRDPRTSYDFEDIVFLLDNRTNLTKDILGAEDEVKKFLANEFQKILEDDTLEEAVLAHLEPASQTERYEMIRKKLEEILNGI